MLIFFFLYIIQGLWVGYFTTGGKLKNFTVNIAFQGTRILGEGRDKSGTFAIAGQRTPTGQVHFIKQYHGKHSVSCDGNLTPDEKSMHGTYTAGDAVGCFIMMLQS